MDDREYVLTHLNFADFYSDHLHSLKPGSGENASALCPFHHDERPSLSVNLEDGLWNCHAGCGGGSVFDFLMRAKDIGYHEALSDLREKAESDYKATIKVRRVLRRHKWVDERGHIAWKLRWSAGDKFTWAQDERGLMAGRGDCTPTLYNLTAVKNASRIFISEGEWDADKVDVHLQQMGWPDVVATTTPNGAKDVKEEYLAALIGKEEVWLTGDNDGPGEYFLARCGHILDGKVGSLRIVRVPAGFKDWAEWIEKGGRSVEFQQLLEGADSFRPPKSQDSNETNPHRLVIEDIGDLLDARYPDIQWIWEGYLPQGGFVTLAGYAKTGKTTFVNHLVAAIVKGEPFLGYPTRQGKILLLAFEEHKRDVVHRIRALTGNAARGQVKLITVTPPYQQDTINQLVSYVNQEGIILVIVDTLPYWWNVRDENKAGEILDKGRLLVQAARATEACWLALAHTRKGGGSFGEDLRGSSALLGLVDVGMSLKRMNENDTRRTLEAVTRYSETPDSLVITLKEGRYESEGGPLEALHKKLAEKVRAILSAGPATVEDILEKADDMTKYGTRKALEALGEEVEKTGTGKKNDPFKYHLKCVSSESSPIKDETNPIQKPGSA